MRAFPAQIPQSRADIELRAVKAVRLAERVLVLVVIVTGDFQPAAQRACRRNGDHTGAGQRAAYALHSFCLLRRCKLALPGRVDHVDKIRSCHAEARRGILDRPRAEVRRDLRKREHDVACANVADMRLVERVPNADRGVGQNRLVLERAVKRFLLARVAERVVGDLALLVEPVNSLLDAGLDTALLEFVGRVQGVALICFPDRHEFREHAAGHLEGPVGRIFVLSGRARSVDVEADFHTRPCEAVHRPLALRRREPRRIARDAARAGDRGYQHIQRNRNIPCNAVDRVENVIGNKVPQDRSYLSQQAHTAYGFDLLACGNRPCIRCDVVDTVSGKRLEEIKVFPAARLCFRPGVVRNAVHGPVDNGRGLVADERTGLSGRAGALDDVDQIIDVDLRVLLPGADRCVVLLRKRADTVHDLCFIGLLRRAFQRRRSVRDDTAARLPGVFGIRLQCLTGCRAVRGDLFAPVGIFRPVSGLLCCPAVVVEDRHAHVDLFAAPVVLPAQLRHLPGVVLRQPQPGVIKALCLGNGVV